jgi:hypothetical protein
MPHFIYEHSLVVKVNSFIKSIAEDSSEKNLQKLEEKYTQKSDLFLTNSRKERFSRRRSFFGIKIRFFRLF